MLVKLLNVRVTEIKHFNMNSKRLTNILATLSIAIVPLMNINAQNARLEVAKNLIYRQSATPMILDNYLFSVYMGSGKKVYNLRGFEIAKVGGDIMDLKVNPAGFAYAVISNEGKRNRLQVFDAFMANKQIFDFGKSLNPVSMTFSADSRFLYVADASSILKKIDSKSMLIVDQWPIPFVPTKMVASKNGYYIVVFSGNNLAVINPENKIVRKSEIYNTVVSGVDFSDDSSLLAILLSSGDVEILNTRDFSSIVASFNCPGANAICVHPDNKYIALSKNGNEIELVNIIDTNERATLPEPTGRVGSVCFLKDGKDNVYLTFNALNAIKYKLIKGLVPNYSKMLREEVVARMEEWSKMAPGESEQEYLTRVNEDSRLIQARLFEEEIATRMADELVSRSTMTLGAYNPSSNTLSIEFDNMPPIYLTVPESDVADFINVSNLEFRNPLYGVTSDDKFELVRQSGMEEVKLTNIKNSVVNQAKRNNLISDHTNIDVSTNILADVDANGKQITNYKVNFRYTVDAGYSVMEDFPAGKFQIAQSNAANSMLQIVSQAFEKDFSQYIKPGKKVVIKITGSADALPISGQIAYDGSFGEFFNEPYYLGGDLSTISLTKNSGIRNNEQLAFARAIAVKNYIANNIRALDSMNTDYKYAVEVSDRKGGEYRRISVEFLFVDTF